MWLICFLLCCTHCTQALPWPLPVLLLWALVSRGAAVLMETDEAVNSQTGGEQRCIGSTARCCRSGGSRDGLPWDRRWPDTDKKHQRWTTHTQRRHGESRKKQTRKQSATKQKERLSIDLKLHTESDTARSGNGSARNGTYKKKKQYRFVQTDKDKMTHHRNAARHQRIRFCKINS